MCWTITVLLSFDTYREKFSSCKFSWILDFEELDKDIELHEFDSLDKLSSSAEFHPMLLWTVTCLVKAFLLFITPLPVLESIKVSFMISCDSSLCTSAQWMLQMRLGELDEGGGFFLNSLKNFMLLSNVGSPGSPLSLVSLSPPRTTQELTLLTADPHWRWLARLKLSLWWCWGRGKIISSFCMDIWWPGARVGVCAGHCKYWSEYGSRCAGYLLSGLHNLRNLKCKYTYLWQTWTKMTELPDSHSWFYIQRISLSVNWLEKDEKNFSHENISSIKIGYSLQWHTKCEAPYMYVYIYKYLFYICFFASLNFALSIASKVSTYS